MTQAPAVRRLPVIPSSGGGVPDTGIADEQQKLAAHEDAAHEKRNWVRLSYDCNNHCTFCLDSNAHDGTMRDDREVRVQIVEGRKKGATRLILSGGEPTMNPLFLEYVRLGRRAGYPKIQTVTNGRMFAYPEFLEKALAYGLSEITFSLHGHTARLHDALVGTPGAFEEEVRGLRAALDSKRVIVNVDIVINKQNVRHLPEMMATFYEWGVREFDLLHVIPFGNAWSDARAHLFYDLEDPAIIAKIREALAYAHRPDVHVWLNRFPPHHAEGYEELIQDPYKLNDEVRGRREEFDRYLSLGQKLMCREPERCKQCYLQDLCDGLDGLIATRGREHVDVVRVAKGAPRPGVLPRATVCHVVAASLDEAKPLAQVVDAPELWLELDRYDGLDAALDGQTLWGRTLRRVVAKEPEALGPLSSLPEGVAIAVHVTKRTAEALSAMAEIPARYVLVQPTYGRVTDARERDVDLRTFFTALAARTPMAELAAEGVAPCLSGRPAPTPRRETLDAATLGSDGRIDMPRYAARYAESMFHSKSSRCVACRHAASCEGMHINWVRAHGYAPLDPVPGG